MAAGPGRHCGLLLQRFGPAATAIAAAGLAHVRTSLDFERKHWTPARSAKRFEAGSPNTIGQAALHASVELLLDYGMENVGQRVLANTGFLIRNLEDIPGVRIAAVTRGTPSGIVSFTHQSHPVHTCTAI